MTAPIRSAIPHAAEDETAGIVLSRDVRTRSRPEPTQADLDEFIAASDTPATTAVNRWLSNASSAQVTTAGS